MRLFSLLEWRKRLVQVHFPCFARSAHLSHTPHQRLICSSLQPRLYDNLHGTGHNSPRPRVVLPSPPRSPPESPRIMQLNSRGNFAGQSSASLGNSFLNKEESEWDGRGNNGACIIAVFLGSNDDAAYDAHNHSSASVSDIPEDEVDRPPSPPPSHRLLYATPTFALTYVFVFVRNSFTFFRRCLQPNCNC